MNCSIVFVFSPGRAIPDASYWLAAAANQNRSGKKDGRRSICVSRCCCPPFLCFFYFQCFDRQLQISCVSILFCVVCSTLWSIRPEIWNPFRIAVLPDLGRECEISPNYEEREPLTWKFFESARYSVADSTKLLTKFDTTCTVTNQNRLNL